MLGAALCRAHDGLGHRLRGEGAYAGHFVVLDRSRGKREDGVAIPHRMGGINRARQPVVSHLCDFGGLRLCETRVRGDDTDRRVLPRPYRRTAARSQQPARVREPFSIGRSDAGHNRAVARIDDVTHSIHRDNRTDNEHVGTRRNRDGCRSQSTLHRASAA